MKHTSPLFVAGIVAVLVASPILAEKPSSAAKLAPECRLEIITLCGADRAQRHTCLKEKSSELSEGCGAELRQRKLARQAKRQEQGQQHGKKNASPAPAPAPGVQPVPQPLPLR